MNIELIEHNSPRPIEKPKFNPVTLLLLSIRWLQDHWPLKPPPPPDKGYPLETL